MSTNDPVPYVFLVMPVSKHACPNSADCWSPAMPLTGTASPAACSGVVTPNRPLLGRTSGRHERGTPNNAHSSSDQPSASMSYRSVRLAFEGSVACTPPSGPPVRRHRIQLSTVPNARSGPASTPPRVSSHSSLVAEK